MLEQLVENVDEEYTSKNHDLTDFHSIDVEVVGEERNNFQGSISHRDDSAQGNQQDPTNRTADKSSEY